MTRRTWWLRVRAVTHRRVPGPSRSGERVDPGGIGSRAGIPDESRGFGSGSGFEGCRFFEAGRLFCGAVVSVKKNQLGKPSCRAKCEISKRAEMKPKPKDSAPDLIPAGRWRAARAEVIAGLPEPSLLDVELVDQMIVSLVEAENALESATKEPFIEGSREQLTEHPGFRLAARCQATALSIAKQLGVSHASTEEEAPKQTTGSVEDELAAIRERKAG